MKRSDMLQIIKKALKDNHIHGKFASVEDADAILKEVEKAGMKPPAFWVNEGKDSFPPDGMPCMHIAWEPEDETP